MCNINSKLFISGDTVKNLGTMGIYLKNGTKEHHQDKSSKSSIDRSFRKWGSSRHHLEFKVFVLLGIEKSEETSFSFSCELQCLVLQKIHSHPGNSKVVDGTSYTNILHTYLLEAIQISDIEEVWRARLCFARPLHLRRFLDLWMNWINERKPIWKLHGVY